ncbi:uncharacterized protein LOC135705217 [Ochlerotatus camptorhynchus]|uniref:uncharacterized protein LOC135705217 n=1 Tax=Ochlerotatus camptorhynchus TaxID=644619 RepID=UPI0031CEE1CF
MGKPGLCGSQKQGGKRTADNNVDARHTKRELPLNQFSLLQEDDGERRESVEKKEKLPPFYVKGQPRELLDNLNVLVRKGLRAEFRLCADGVKITVPSAEHYKSVAETLQLWKVEYFTHDVQSTKPFKVILRGLHELDVSIVEEELQRNNLQPVKVFVIKRHNEAIKYRGQLYLVHLVGGSTNMRQLQSIRTLLSVVVEWERYKPVHREVTQCTSCLNFGRVAPNAANNMSLPNASWT